MLHEVINSRLAPVYALISSLPARVASSTQQVFPLGLPYWKSVTTVGIHHVEGGLVCFCSTWPDYVEVSNWRRAFCIRGHFRKIVFSITIPCTCPLDPASTRVVVCVIMGRDGESSYVFGFHIVLKTFLLSFPCAAALGVSGSPPSLYRSGRWSGAPGLSLPSSSTSPPLVHKVHDSWKYS